MRNLAKFLIFGILLLSLLNCSGGAQKTVEDMGGDTLTSSATLLKMVDCGDYIYVEITDPWRGEPMARMALIDREADEAMVPDGCIPVRVPVERSAVFSSVHTSPLFELGCGDAITAVADGQYFPKTDIVSELLSSGQIADIGSSMSPDVERLLGLETETVLLSPMQDSDHSALTRAGISVVPMADYLETTPLARAEWVKLLGALYGALPKADSLYAAVEEEYNMLAEAAKKTDERPKVLTENISSGVWYVPAGDSYMARMIADAGGYYPWADIRGTGSIPLDAEGVLDRGADADVWLIRTFGPVPGYQDISRDNPAAEHIKAFREHKVYGCNTAENNIFRDIAFHPERVLRDFVGILHPNEQSADSLLYYRPL